MSVPMQECTFHMTFAIIYYEITEKMHLCFFNYFKYRHHLLVSCKHECMGEVKAVQYCTVVDLSLQGCLIRVEWFRHLSAFKLSTLY